MSMVEPPLLPIAEPTDTRSLRERFPERESVGKRRDAFANHLAYFVREEFKRDKDNDARAAMNARGRAVVELAEAVELLAVAADMGATAPELGALVLAELDRRAKACATSFDRRTSPGARS